MVPHVRKTARPQDRTTAGPKDRTTTRQNNPREGNDFYRVFNDFRSIANSYSMPERP